MILNENNFFSKNVHSYRVCSFKGVKSSRTFYDILAHVDEIGVTNRWRNQLGNISNKK